MKNRMTHLIAVAALVGFGTVSTAAMAESETPSPEMPMMQRGQDGMMMHGQASEQMAKCREQMSGDAGAMMGPMGGGMTRHNMHAQMQDYMQNCMGQMRGGDHMRGGMMMGQ
ncbi:MAG: hypothetical protein RLO08_03900 [Parvibaculaceae bacterium]